MRKWVQHDTTFDTGSGHQWDIMGLPPSIHIRMGREDANAPITNLSIVWWPGSRDRRIGMSHLVTNAKQAAGLAQAHLFHHEHRGDA